MNWEVPVVRPIFWTGAELSSILKGTFTTLHDKGHSLLTVFLRYGRIDVVLAEEIFDARQAAGEHRVHQRGLAVAGAFGVDVRAGSEGILHARDILRFDQALPYP